MVKGCLSEGWMLQVALLSLDEDETELMDHLNAAKDVLGNPLYSPQFALRVARQRGSQRASVALLCQLNLLEVCTYSPATAVDTCCSILMDI